MLKQGTRPAFFLFIQINEANHNLSTGYTEEGVMDGNSDARRVHE